MGVFFFDDEAMTLFYASLKEGGPLTDAESRQRLTAFADAEIFLS
jgi:hypothetical protein